MFADNNIHTVPFPGLGVKALNKMPSLQSLHDGMDESNYYEDEIPLLDDSNARKGRGTDKGIYDVKGWDVFRALPPGTEGSGSVRCWEITTQILKIVMYFITFVVVLGCAVTSKGSLLFMTSQIKWNRNINLCKVDNGKSGDSTLTATVLTPVTISWIWGIYFAFCMSEIFTFFACLRQVLFKRIMTPRPSVFFTVLLMETLHTIGVCLFLYEVLPSLDAVRGAMLTNCLCFIPSCLNLLSRPRSESHRFIKTVVDILAIMAQANGFILIPLIQPVNKPWAIPLSLILTSVGWWENYVDRNSAFPFIQSIALYKDELKKSRYKTYMFVSLWKCIVMFGAMIGFLAMDMPELKDLFPSKNPFGPQSFNVKKITNISGTIGEVPFFQKTQGYESLIVCSVQIISSFICYYAGKFACRICIQGFSFAFPFNLVMPVTVSLLIALCGLKAEDSCFFTSIIPDYIYWECFRGDVIKNLVAQEHAWVWLLWLFSQTWITLHIWSPKCERLAKTEKLFVLPMYHGLFIDQSMVLNRRRDDEAEVRTEDIDLNKQEGIVPEDVSAFYETISVDTEASSKESKIHKHPDTLTKIYCCATMWHETSSEMQQMLKSVMRMDEDQSARRNAQQYLRVVDPDYYEFEVHIFFDDAFEISDENEDENQVNDFVKQLINVMDTAASAVHQCNIRLRPPKKVPTPYGGRLIWILPGKNKLTAHLKDKSKIRHRKRWSQVMYMYYLLGNRLMELPIDVNRKEVLAENTFILTLDGDIDFRPHAVQLLVDLMKKNHNLGATCGRIHPIGSGPMVWYQKFEYAIGHWLQKATEHMIGCVLCSPGCFSLFRAKALMDDNCMRRYTLKSEEARHYVQFDQGEDRWLCTLLLQRGYRVEYCAASDAYTHAPEGFVEFYNQRRRWVPSTIANIMDLLMDYKTTIKVNDNISFGYILYQMALMLGTLLGPGTIFLMIVGACVAAFRISNWTSFMGNIAPILLFMIICFLCKAEIQLIFAQILSAGYAMLMMAVIVGTTLQMTEDGTGSPSAIFMFTLIGSFLIAALLHPQEFFCIVHGLLYFLSIPSMYLLLMIYSLCNLNNVTWGTREVQTKKTREELQEEKKREEELKKAQRANLLFGLLGNKNTEEKNDGFLSFGCGNLFRCLLCVDSRKDGDRAELIRINAGIEELGKKIEKLENKLRPPPDEWENHALKINPREKIREQMRSEPIENHYEELPNERQHSRDFDDLKSIRDDLINPFWIEDKTLRRGEVEYLPPMEIQFWKDLIAKYLHPLDENKEHKARMARDLKDLRNKCTFGFFMFNGLFILIVFLLQLNKDTLHIDWPFGAKINTTFNEETGAIDHQEITPLHLEPIGLVFVVFFMLILVIQFIAMIFHRFGTLSHILATTELSCFKSKITDFGDNAFIEKNAVEIARNLQALRGLDDDYHVLDYDFSPNGVALRRTIHHLEKYGKGKPKTGTLDVAFKKRFFALTAENGPAEANTPVRLRRNLTLRAETIRAIERRRNTVFGNKANRMETLGANGHVPGMKTGKGRRRLDSVFQPDSDGFQGYHNETYDRAGSESNLINNDGINMKTVTQSQHSADSWEQNDLNENITNSVL